jgi:hypothetical protein
MPGLEQAFYIVALVFMGVIFVILIGILAAVLVIRKKIVSVHDSVQAKFGSVMSVATKGAAIAKTVGKVVKHKGR